MLSVKGRHDPCVLPRAPPLVEGMTPAFKAAILYFYGFTKQTVTVHVWVSSNAFIVAVFSHVLRTAMVLMDAVLRQRARTGAPCRTLGELGQGAGKAARSLAVPWLKALSDLPTFRYV